jgi:hypothetical protein
MTRPVYLAEQGQIIEAVIDIPPFIVPDWEG